MKAETMDIDILTSRIGSMRIAEPHQPFRFFALPYELRLRIYELILLSRKTIDLDPANYRAIRPLLSLFFVSHRMHDEAARVFYRQNTFRIFPIHGRFFHTKKPLLMRLPAHYRALITNLELRLGPGWTKPPKGWVVDERLHLEDVVKARTLKVFVECDPASDPIFEGFRVGEDFYTLFCVELVTSLFAQVPTFTQVEFDAYPGITKASPLLQALVNEAKGRNMRIGWGPEREWEKIVEANLTTVLEGLSL